MLRSLLRYKSASSLLRQAPGALVGHQELLSRTLASKLPTDFAVAAQEENKRRRNPFARDEDVAEMHQEQPPVAHDNVTPAQREQLLKVLQLEADIAFQEGRRVPALEFFTTEHWAHVLTLGTKSARAKYYSYLWQLEMKKLSKERKKIERAESVVRRKEERQKERAENEHILYGLSDTSMFLRIYDSAINHWQNNRLTRAMQFAPKIVLDCSYDAHMNKREAQNAAKQLMLCFAENRAHDDPFDMHYCNVRHDSDCVQALHRYIPTMLNPEFPMNVHEQCFTELFPRENLVYLTPHCRNDLEAYEPDDVYIVGAMVDKMNNEPLSLAKAKRLKLRMARLPLDRYLQWSGGSGKSLTLNQMILIMLDLKRTGNWETALRHVPRRKLVDLELEALQHKRKMQKNAQRLNVRIDRVLEEDEHDRVAPAAGERAVRSRKQDQQFNLATWASGKKQRHNTH